MGKGEQTKKRENIYFRQTPKEFKSQKQTAIYYHIKKNLPYSLFVYTKEKVINVLKTAHEKFFRFPNKLPKDAKRIKA